MPYEPTFSGGQHLQIPYEWFRATQVLNESKQSFLNLQVPLFMIAYEISR